ncbi:MAG: hypothetical protein K0B10_11545 [Vicingaceae bacterium]|nr:hypothetical protein [Vicingaceae bacterium]
MKTKKITLIALTSLIGLSFTVVELNEVKGWFLRGSEPSSYEIGIVEDSQRNGKVAYLKSINPEIKNKFGTIMQSFSAEKYLDSKLKLTGYIKTKDVTGWAGMWMRVDGKKKHSLSFDNMGNRKIKKTTDWTKYEIILDVPKDSKSINYGVLLSNEGIVWIDDLTFEVVSKSLKSTGKTLPSEPENNSFEK